MSREKRVVDIAERVLAIQTESHAKLKDWEGRAVLWRDIRALAAACLPKPKPKPKKPTGRVKIGRYRFRARARALKKARTR